MGPFSQDHRRRESFGHLARTHSAVMVAVARRLAGPGEAEDVAQAALAAAWPLFRDAGSLQNPRAWLLRFVVNQCRNLAGRRARQGSPLAFDETVHAGPVEDILLALQRAQALVSERDPSLLLDCLDEGLAGAVQAIPPDERTVLILRAIGELSYREIAAATGVPIGTVMSRLSRARAKVRAGLAEHCGRPSQRKPAGDANGEREGGCSSDRTVQ